MTTPDTVKIDSTVLQSLIKHAEQKTEPTNSVITTAKNTLSKQANTNDVDSSLITDELFEKYGYGIYNTHKKQFVRLPDTLVKRQKSNHNVTRLQCEQPHIISDWNADILAAVAEQYGIDSVEHLRVVSVHLANTRDKHAIEVIDEDC